MKSFISIITVNYNGQKYLPDFINSVKKLKYPKDRFELLFVDNGSTDGSIDYVKKNYPDAKILNSGENLGFGKGNNLGINLSRGEFVFLVNNDTILDTKVLENTLKRARKHSKRNKIGAVAPKILLIDHYIHVVFKDALFKNVVNLKKFKSREPYIYRMLNDRGEHTYEDVFIPLNYEHTGGLKIIIEASRFRKSRFELKLCGQTIKGMFKGPFEIIEVFVESEKLRRNKIDLIQNAGNYYFRDGYGRDRGSIVNKSTQYYEVDNNQYNDSIEVPGFCGAGVLINKRALSDIGFFDEDFFMYYEDGDLSLRMKKKSWKIIYEPSAIIRHVHSGSSKEWSNFFIYNVEKSRLLFIAKNWPRYFAISELVKYILLNNIFLTLYYLKKKKRKKAMNNLFLRCRVIYSLMVPFTKSLFQTGRLSKTEVGELL